MRKFFPVLAVLIILLAGTYYWRAQKGPTVVQTDVDKTKINTQISITAQEIQEENYTGSRPVITGEGKLAEAGREYVENTVEEFVAQANTDVPAMRKSFGMDSPVASYTIDLEASQAESDTTRSLILSVYVYAGGAHGSSSYKVFTASRATGEILSLADLISADKRADFLTLVKNELSAWSPNDSEPVVFEEEVANLLFESLTNWSLDDTNLTLYFSQYEIGPGALGAFRLPIQFDGNYSPSRP